MHHIFVHRHAQCVFPVTVLSISPANLHIIMIFAANCAYSKGHSVPALPIGIVQCKARIVCNIHPKHTPYGESDLSSCKDTSGTYGLQECLSTASVNGKCCYIIGRQGCSSWVRSGVKACPPPGGRGTPSLPLVQSARTNTPSVAICYSYIGARLTDILHAIICPYSGGTVS